MALCRRLIGADGPDRHFGQSCGIPILFGLSSIHGKLWLETASLVKNTPLAVLFSSANQPQEGVDLLRNSRPVGTEVLLQANSAKERDDQAREGIIVVTRSTRGS
jgi:hypothetical protein